MELPELKKGTRIYDLLKEAGMELNNWVHANDPSKSTFWAWIEGDIAVMSIWEDNISAPALPSESYYTRYIARGQGHKGDAVDNIYKAIIKHNLPVHVIIKTRDKKRRILDPITWSATYNDSTGEITLIRGCTVTYIDQKGPITSASITSESPAAARSRKLRQLAMARSRGKCEFCDEPGFRTVAGAIFAEVHHIVPISEDGPDDLSNLIVLCPNDHRRAHHGENAVAMKLAFIETRKTNI
ncbi:HNH endonuclease signature motif containing protein [Yersinia thracica]|uniref:HNH endonuclease n=1 Tax=Yersinia thracica TaxID=2890319 RepID=UPI0011A0AD4A|nr:HNH endonuclease signature motif containing protein [Yersinia thracica]